MNIEQFWAVAKVLVYLTYYITILIFSIKHRKDIYKAACGGNGVPQPNELIKLFAVYSFCIYSNEVIFGGLPFNLEFGLMLLGAIGIANLGKFKMSEINFKSKKDDKDIEYLQLQIFFM